MPVHYFGVFIISERLKIMNKRQASLPHNQNCEAYLSVLNLVVTRPVAVRFLNLGNRLWRVMEIQFNIIFL